MIAGVGVRIRGLMVGDCDSLFVMCALRDNVPLCGLVPSIVF